ncbi:unnamed protein product, partial [marine sediment metagenome]
TDAHRIDNLGLMGFGIATAARGWTTKHDVLNTLSADKIKTWAKSKRL